MRGAEFGGFFLIKQGIGLEQPVALTEFGMAARR